MAEAVEGTAAPVVVHDAVVVALKRDRRSGFSGMCRPVVEYIGYTCLHLPEKNGRLPPSAVDATAAIFAARMARSSLEIRSQLRYGERALSNAC